MTLINADWKNLVLINYSIDPKLLESYIPKGTELDLHNNKCFVSLVGFMFKNTKLLGIKVPNLINFEEVNLRFYVKRKVKNEWRRGVVFIKEIVPKHLITFTANTLYHEHYETRKMSHKWLNNDNSKTIEYSWELKNRTQTMSIETQKTASSIPTESEEAFITEHYFGYTKKGSTTYEYEVTHPKWNQYNVLKYKIDVDFESNYGIPFKILNSKSPDSVIVAVGSQITVKNKLKL
ncbi:YqjF family protein [Lacinutrix mariniflava]|uniref:YqjF family protein n=1 Tax=Lacinutrix mariniflava TaxID=342955 RepID=UPI0006E3D2E0|nr:DUF2071 domain-containing protein [Lacinutrix mariniflava]